MVCLVVNHFLSLSAVALAGAAANNAVVLPKKLGRYFIDTWSLLASFWGFQRTQSGHIWGGPNMSCWKGDALNIDLFGSTAFWGRIGEQNRHTCHWNTTTPANAAAALDCYLPKPSDWTSGFFSFTDATADFSQEMGSWRVTSLKKYLTASLLVPRLGTRLLKWKVKGVIRSNCQVHFASEDETRPFLKHDDLMLQSFKRQAFYYCLPPSFS